MQEDFLDPTRLTRTGTILGEARNHRALFLESVSPLKGRLTCIQTLLRVFKMVRAQFECS